jgi:hypothetical protein
MRLLFRTALTQKVVAAGAVALLASGVAVGAFASQDKLPGQAHHALVSQLETTATSTDTATATATDTSTATATATGTVTPTVEPEDTHHGDCTATTTVTVTETPTATATATSTPTATATSTTTVVAGGENDDRDDDQGDNGQGKNGDHSRDCDVKGIPATNPNHQPEAIPGVCQKGETVIKTTPSGEQVNVPCQADDKGDGHENNGKNEEEGADSASDD